MEDTEAMNILGYILDETARRLEVMFENIKQNWV